ncbi:hypothetical protein [Okeania sp. SIO2C2]|nr:hypothetical protein [Okeania sp. SIO2C2]
MEVFWYEVGVRRTSSGVRRNGEFRGGSRIFYPLIFLQLFCLLS